MRDFITCLEFLTRIRFSNRTDWRDDDFAKSVPYFPFGRPGNGCIHGRSQLRFAVRKHSAFHESSAFDFGRAAHNWSLDVRRLYGHL